MDETLLSRVEDASLNASAPTQQLWLDGWLVRTCPGKARRARSINPVAPGRMPLVDKLALAAEVYRAAGLPMVLRLTRFSLPADLDQGLAALGYTQTDTTRVKTLAALPRRVDPPLPAGLHWDTLPASEFAEAVGVLRGSPPQQRWAHAQRLAHSPVPYHGHVIRRHDDGAVLACGQVAREAELVGVYDVFTHPGARGQGLAHLLCERMLSLSAQQGAKTAYLQVEAGNAAADAVYQRLGFVDAYTYHYREAP